MKGKDAKFKHADDRRKRKNMIRSGIILVSLIVGGCLIPVILAALQKDNKKAEISGNLLLSILHLFRKRCLQSLIINLQEF